LTSSPSRLPTLRAAGIVPLVGDLDRPATLARLADLADAVLHLAPPAASGERDQRTTRLVHALARSKRLRRLVYGSTSGVYGDCAGERIDETRPLRPASDRARRRVDAEARVRWLGRASGVAVTVLRIPGIYALDREGGDPRVRVKRGTPLLVAEDDVFTGHIHADDLARACVAALHRGPRQRAINVADDSALKMGDYFEYVADRFSLARPPRLSRDQAARVLSPMQISFLGESRRLSNERMKAELGLVLRHPTVVEGLSSDPRERRGEGE
jgi:nucleoside-diphosphate-sugar epimerase